LRATTKNSSLKIAARPAKIWNVPIRVSSDAAKLIPPIAQPDTSGLSRSG
jgi:hypothetical protein